MPDCCSLFEPVEAGAPPIPDVAAPLRVDLRFVPLVPLLRNDFYSKFKFCVA